MQNHFAFLDHLLELMKDMFANDQVTNSEKMLKYLFNFEHVLKISL